MNGYQGLVNDILALTLSYITLAVSLIEFLLPEDLSRALNLLYQYTISSGSWAGFLTAAVYYFGVDVGYAEYFCIISKYIYISVYWLSVVVTLGQNKREEALA